MITFDKKTEKLHKEVTAWFQALSKNFRAANMKATHKPARNTHVWLTSKMKSGYNAGHPLAPMTRALYQHGVPSQYSTAWAAPAFTAAKAGWFRSGHMANSLKVQKVAGLAKGSAGYSVTFMPGATTAGPRPTPLARLAKRLELGYSQTIVIPGGVQAWLARKLGGGTSHKYRTLRVRVSVPGRPIAWHVNQTNTKPNTERWFRNELAGELGNRLPTVQSRNVARQSFGM